MDRLTAEIIENYSYFDEDNRLSSSYGILEEEHTRRLIWRHIHSKDVHIYDIGAGTGHYTAWLAGLGFTVHFSDIVPKHVDLFRERHATSKNISSIGVEDARNLSYQDNSADLIILNGPLYHLPERTDRIRALQEAKRILKTGGLLLGFSISRFSGLNYALSSGEVFNDNYFEMAKQEVITGLRDNTRLKNKTFIRAYFHLVEDIEAEFVESGLQVQKSFGVAGPGWITPDLDNVVKDVTRKERLLEIAEIMEGYPMQSPKILTVGVK